jgi:hypothetical protein
MRWSIADGQLRTTLDDGTNPVTVSVALGEAEVLVFDFGGPRAFFVRST